MDDISAVILAGGSSSRMGANKLLLPLGQSTVIGSLVDRVCGLFTDCVVVTDCPADFRLLPVRLADDLIDCGVRNSLAGIHGGLSAAVHPYSFVVAGDMPFPVPALVRYLCSLRHGYDVVIPRQDVHFQPLFAVYHRNCLVHIENLLARGRYKIVDFLRHVRARQVDVSELRAFDPGLISFFNVNTPEDYLLAREMLARNL
jgi:molybdopterin-guanine dinucleotide biosynthesis protein A